jgi:hypothetical protein
MLPQRFGTFAHSKSSCFLLQNVLAMELQKAVEGQVCSNA